MGTDPHFGFSRACVDHVVVKAVRPQRNVCAQCRSVNAVDEKEILVKGDEGDSEGVGGEEIGKGHRPFATKQGRDL